MNPIIVLTIAGFEILVYQVQKLIHHVRLGPSEKRNKESHFYAEPYGKELKALHLMNAQIPNIICEIPIAIALDGSHNDWEQHPGKGILRFERNGDITLDKDLRDKIAAYNGESMRMNQEWVNRLVADITMAKTLKAAKKTATEAQAQPEARPVFEADGTHIWKELKAQLKLTPALLEEMLPNPAKRDTNPATSKQDQGEFDF